MLTRINDRRLSTTAAGWLFGSGGLLLTLIAYCELCSAIFGEPTAGARVSLAWALQAGAGWIVVGAGFALFGERISASRLARDRATLLLCGVVVGCAAAAMLTEAWLVYAFEGAPITGSRNSIAALLYERAPVSVLASALLTGAWIANQRHHRAIDATTTSATQPPSAARLEAPAPGCAEMLEVLTGAGRATIRIDEIESFRADRNYITVAHASGRRYLLRQTMASLERSLDPARFERVHRSTIVNRAMIVERRTRGVLVLKSGEAVKSSRSRRKQL